MLRRGGSSFGSLQSFLWVSGVFSSGDAAPGSLGGSLRTGGVALPVDREVFFRGSGAFRTGCSGGAVAVVSVGDGGRLAPSSLVISSSSSLLS